MRVIVIALIWASMTLAQMGPPDRGSDPPAYFPWWESPISGRLNLTPEQQTQIQNIQRDYRDQMIDQRAAIDKAEAAIRDLFAAGGGDSDAADAAINQMVAARGALTRSITEMALKIRDVLTDEQWQQLTELQGRGFRRRGGGGPDGSGRRGSRER